MPYGKVNPTGCTERYGLIQVRLDLFLESGDVRYNDPRFYQIDTSSAAYLQGYTGKLDKEGQPRDLEAYAKWEASLPRIWLPERCFHHHFIYLDPYTLRDEQITSAMSLHVPNFYKAWTEEWDKVQGGMRHGWDVACRKPRPTRYNLKEPELYVARKAECLAKVDVLQASSFATKVTEIGETFPATEIDIGSAAIDRNLYLKPNLYTLVNIDNPANESGAIDTVEVYGGIAGNNLWAGTFSHGGSNVLTCRDSQSCGGWAAGTKTTFTGLDITVEAGDYLGCFNKGLDESGIDRSTSGFSGVWFKSGEYIDPGDSATFSIHTDDTMSLYGTGDTGAEPDIYAADTSRHIVQASQYAADSMRPLRQVQAFAADCTRILQAEQASAADLFRQLCSVEAYVADTLRVVVLTLNDIYPADTRRLIRASQSYGADTMRRIASAEACSADALRRIAESVAHSADTFRLARADMKYQADALRMMLGWQSYSADTLRLVQEDLRDRFAADTLRLIYVVRPFRGPPYVLEIRNQSGQLLAIPRLLSGTLTRSLNAPDALSAMIAADDPAREHITPANLIYVRDDSGAVVSVCIPAIEEREHR